MSDGESAGSEKGSILEFLAEMATDAFFAVGDFVTGDRSLAAAFRQGLDELGEALKPLPDSIQIDESGSLWNPTQGEIAQAAHQGNAWGYDGPTPGEIAASNAAYAPDQDMGQDLGEDMGF